MSKYGNKRTELDGVVFDSKREAARYQELKLLERAGHITRLELQPRFPLVVNGHKVGTYIADFRYIDTVSLATITEDVKSEPTKTPVYQLKKKLVAALYQVQIVEV